MALRIATAATSLRVYNQAQQEFLKNDLIKVRENNEQLF
jgi:hypothetical protein